MIPELPEAAERFGVFYLDSLSYRTANILVRHGIVDADQIFLLGNDLKRLNGIGPKVFDEIRYALIKSYCPYFKNWPEYT